MKNWKDFREKLDLDDNKKFYWRQIIPTKILVLGKKCF